MGEVGEYITFETSHTMNKI